MYGIGGVVYKWFENYLTGRTQQTKCGSAVSEGSAVNIGVPQGSILGPLLFILYINDMPRVLKYCKIHMFADDTLIYITGKDICNMFTRINKDLKLLNCWLGDNVLKINTEKTKCMLLGTTRICNEVFNLKLQIKVNCDVIGYVERMKYLGVSLDNKLNFNSHMDGLTKKLGKKISFFGRISGSLSSRARNLVYNTIVQPHFLYRGTLLFSASIGQLSNLQILQNRAMRIILKETKYARINDMLKELKWLSILKLAKG